MSQRMIYQTDKTREKILNTAECCFSVGGFFETQMKDIATAAGMSRNTLYRYYRDKFELGFAILEKTLKQRFIRLDEKISELLESDNIDVPTALANLFTESYISPEADLEHRFVAEFDSFYAGDRIPEDLRERLSAAAGHSNAFGRLDLLVERGQQEGSIRADLDAHIISATLSNAIQAFHQRMILRKGALIEFEPGQSDAMTPLVIKLLIDGLKPTSPNHN